MELRPYQLEARDRILAELGEVWSTLLVLATGLGKTVVLSAVALAYVALGHRVLVVAHRKELLEQLALTLRRFGLTVGIERAEQRVDPAALPDVVVASIQTMQGRRLASFPPDAFALVVIDEAHHAVAKTYRTMLDYFSGARVLGVTATPDRADGVGLRHGFASEAYRMELGDGIKAGWLAPLEVRTVMVEHADISRVRTVAGELVAAEVEQALVNEQALDEVATPLAELAGGRQTLAFVAGVKQAHELARVLREYGVKAAAVDGSMSSKERATVLADYRDKRVQVVCNAMLLTEGYDCPETSCIALVRPTRARGLLVQMIGRGTRLAEGKASCLVLDFVPGRTGSIRLAAPADALAGVDIPAPLLARVRKLSEGQTGELGALMVQAQAELDAEKEAALEQARQIARDRRRLVQEMGVVYAAPRVDVHQLLEAVYEPDKRALWPEKSASPSQLEALRKAGFEVPESLSSRQAHALFEVLAQRRAAGLCTLKQARRLRSYGLRDDVTFELASKALDVIARNGWQPPMWLLRDPRFVRDLAA